MGMTHGEPNTYPRTADVVGYCWPEKALAVGEAVVTLGAARMPSRPREFHPAHRYFQPHGWSRLCFFPWHRRPGSHVPYESPNESHASSTPDATWTVSRTPSMLIPEVWHASGFDVV